MGKNGKNGKDGISTPASKAALGVVRIGDDINIDSESGIISIDTDFDDSSEAWQLFQKNNSLKAILAKIFSSLKFLKKKIDDLAESSGGSSSKLKVVEQASFSLAASSHNLFEGDKETGTYLVNVSEYSNNENMGGKNAMLKIEAYDSDSDYRIVIQTLYPTDSGGDYTKARRRYLTFRKVEEYDIWNASPWLKLFSE